MNSRANNFAGERATLTLQADLCLNLVLVFFLLIGQGATKEEHARTKAAQEAASAPDDVRLLRLTLIADGRFHLDGQASPNPLQAAALPVVWRQKHSSTNSPTTIALTFPASMRAGDVHAALRALGEQFPKAELRQVIQSQGSPLKTPSAL